MGERPRRTCSREIAGHREKRRTMGHCHLSDTVRRAVRTKGLECPSRSPFRSLRSEQPSSGHRASEKISRVRRPARSASCRRLQKSESSERGRETIARRSHSCRFRWIRTLPSARWARNGLEPRSRPSGRSGRAFGHRRAVEPRGRFQYLHFEPNKECTGRQPTSRMCSYARRFRATALRPMRCHHQQMPRTG